MLGYMTGLPNFAIDVDFNENKSWNLMVTVDPELNKQNRLMGSPAPS